MCSSFRGFLLAATILGCTVLVSGGVRATPTLVGTTTNPTGINGLVVDGIIYDVTFSTTTLNSFVEGSSVSIDANQALASALNSLSVTGLGNSSAQSAYEIDIDNSLSSFDGPYCSTTPTPCGSIINTWQAGGGTIPNLGSSSLFFSEAADFTEVGTVGVPEPLTLSLFGAGLIGAAAIRRRKKVGA